ncbi:unnamed protein product [Oppiella nova]|uniref:Uncharacterized protein n=1 Tax=Oppiella nova TaxID=334625 RepID=A0A7R9MQD5_9ACAR|nr:unnamed protein product [Oppiella nova]CAG2181140.1 unnamed protein product [Oppiella nova]
MIDRKWNLRFSEGGVGEVRFGRPEFNHMDRFWPDISTWCVVLCRVGNTNH